MRSGLGARPLTPAPVLLSEDGLWGARGAPGSDAGQPTERGARDAGLRLHSLRPVPHRSSARRDGGSRTAKPRTPPARVEAPRAHASVLHDSRSGGGEPMKLNLSDRAVEALKDALDLYLRIQSEHFI